MSLQQTLGNQATLGLLQSGLLQPKLRVGAAHDAHEPEADLVAERVMGTESSKPVPDGGVSGQQDAGQRIQAGFLSNVLEGLTSASRAVGAGIAKLSAEAWSGIKAAGKWTWQGIKAIGKWGWNSLKAAGAWVWDLVTEAPIRVWRLLKHAGSGIVGTVSWLRRGLKGLLGHAWEAVTGALTWLGEGTYGLFEWLWQGLQGGRAWALKVLQGDFSALLEGIGGLFSWLGEGAKRLAAWGAEGIAAAAKWAWEGTKGLAKWLLDGFLSGGAWVLRLLAKLLDLAGFPEAMDLLWQIIKFNSRPLTKPEIAEARKVFGDTIPYWQVRVDEYSLIAAIGSLFSGGGGMGVTLFYAINFNRKIKPAPGTGDMGWLVHELGHVWQMEHVGMQYIGEAIHAQATTGYVYGVDSNYRNNANGTKLANERANGKTLDDFNREQQATIAEHYYMRKTSGLSVVDWQPYIDDFRNP